MREESVSLCSRGMRDRADNTSITHWSSAISLDCDDDNSEETIQWSENSMMIR